LILQREGDEIVSERDVYRLALQEGVIDRTLWKRLERLYAKRNRVLHRYVISDITTQQVLEIAIEFEAIIPLLSTAVGVLESEQIRRNIGMTRDNSDSSASARCRSLQDLALEKHGDSRLGDRLRDTEA
jgi:hypothetical protein